MASPEVFQTVFRQQELVKQFEKCWTIGNYYVNRAMRAWAIEGDIEIEPVLFRGDVDGYKAAELSGERLVPRLRIAAMVWPSDIDPTSCPPKNQGPSIERAWLDKLKWLASLMSNNAQHIRSLSVRMSLSFDLSPMYTPGIDVHAMGLAWKYEPTIIFLAVG